MEIPTKSIQKNLKYIDNKINYNKLTVNEKLEYDLKDTIYVEKQLKHTIKGKGYNSKKLIKYINKIVGKFDPDIKHIKNLIYAGKDLLSIRINEDKFENRHFTINKIKQISNKLSNYLNKKNINGKNMTSLLYGQLGWKSGYLRKFGDDTKLYDPNQLYNLEVPYEEPKSIKSFNIYIALGNRDIGGSDDKFNDCLYNCLKYFVFNIEDYYKSPAELKKQLKLKRNDKIPLSCIDIIEKKLKNFQINIRGDYIRSSTIQSNKIINITLINEHYEVEKQNIILTPYIKYDEKTPIMWDKKTFDAYDGNKKWRMSKQERNKIIYDYKSPYILINREEQGRDENDEKIIITIEEEYKQFIEIADALKKESKGMINLYKTGSYHDTALSLFERITKFIHAEVILQDEAEYIKNTSFGALICAEKYNGELYKYDVKSLYPFLMNSNTLKFPIKRGEFKIIESFNDFFEFGIYRCKIEKSEDENINKIFKFNYHNYYTSIDLTNAKQLGLNIELIKDNKPNFLYYSRDKLITCNEVFKNYIDILFPLKDNNIKKSKIILNILWGSLCEIDKRKQYIQTSFKIEEDEEICEIYPSSDDTSHILKTTKFNKYYKTPYARLCPFIIAQGRKHMSNIMFEHKNNILRIQTDGFLINKCIHSNTNVKLGELRWEGYTPNGIITNCINKAGIFKF